MSAVRSMYNPRFRAIWKILLEKGPYYPNKDIETAETATKILSTLDARNERGQFAGLKKRPKSKAARLADGGVKTGPDTSALQTEVEDPKG